MIEIKYSKSYAGYDNCFTLTFYLKDYIPDAFFKKYGIDEAEIRFYISLLIKHGMFERKKENCITTVLGDTHFYCRCDGVPFTMVYGDYGMISFSVSPEDIKYRNIIAERIKHLIITDGKNINAADFIL